MRLAEPDPEGNVAVPSILGRGKGACDFCGLTGVTRKTLHENGRKLGEADLFFLGGEGLCKLEMTLRSVVEMLLICFDSVFSEV